MMAGLDGDSRNPNNLQEAATRVATNTLAYCFVVFWLALLMPSALDNHWTFISRLILLGMGTLPVVGIAGFCIGWISCRMFGSSPAAVTRAAFLLGLLGFFTVVGWFLVFILNPIQRRISL
jgi:hypothetical protein